MAEPGAGPQRAVIISASSDIGAALARRWLARGWDLAGTYRTLGPVVEELAAAGMRLVPCDLADVASTRTACCRLREEAWDVLVLCPGRLEPVGPFADGDFDDWEESVRVNLTGPLRLLHGLLPARRLGGGLGPCVLLFAGGGTNDAPVNYSAYTLSKVALVKACELLDAEVPDTRFVILGTGWVKTKIHQATLRAGARAGPNYERTLAKLAGDGCTPLEKVLDCCDWAVRAPRRLAGGRNFSVAHDPWGRPELDEELAARPDMYKLRRAGNDWSPRQDLNPNRSSMTHSPTLNALLASLPSVRGQHAPESAPYALLKRVARSEVERLFRQDSQEPRGFGPFGGLAFPYFRMGAIDSLSLFDLDELILFSFYWHNRDQYRRVLDIGANIGLHSIILSRCGFEVRCFEPDPTHFAVLQRNLVLNGCAGVTPVNAAVSRTAGTLEFVRVLGNTTGSHLAGSKPAPYGELERFPVQVESFGPLLGWADLVKMDVEGHEGDILLGTTRQQWQKADCLVEIGSPANAHAVFDHFRSLGLRLFAQKTGWGLVESFAAMPLSYREGSLFITCKDEMPWGEAVDGTARRAS